MRRNKKIPAFSLTDSLVAMLLLSISLACSFGLFQSLLLSGSVQKRQQAVLKVEEVYQEINAGNRVIKASEKWKEDAWVLELNSRKFQGQADLVLVEVMVYNAKRKLLHKERRLIPSRK